MTHTSCGSADSSHLFTLIIFISRVTYVAQMSARDAAEEDPRVLDKKDAEPPTPLELENAEYPMSNLRLLVLGAAFFALWAGNVSSVEKLVKGMDR